MNSILQRSYSIIAIVFMGLTALLYLVLLGAMLGNGYTLSSKPTADFAAILLLGATSMLQLGFYVMVIKYKVYWLSLVMAIICWIGVYKTAINLHKLPPDMVETYWDGLGEQLFPKSRR